MLTEYFNVKKNGPSGPSSPWEAVIMKRKARQGKRFDVYVEIDVYVYFLFDNTRCVSHVSICLYPIH